MHQEQENVCCLFLALIVLAAIGGIIFERERQINIQVSCETPPKQPSLSLAVDLTFTLRHPCGLQENELSMIYRDLRLMFPDVRTHGHSWDNVYNFTIVKTLTEVAKNAKCHEYTSLYKLRDSYAFRYGNPMFQCMQLLLQSLPTPRPDDNTKYSWTLCKRYPEFDCPGQDFSAAMRLMLNKQREDLQYNIPEKTEPESGEVWMECDIRYGGCGLQGIKDMVGTVQIPSSVILEDVVGTVQIPGKLPSGLTQPIQGVAKDIVGEVVLIPDGVPSMHSTREPKSDTDEKDKFTSRIKHEQ